MKYQKNEQTVPVVPSVLDARFRVGELLAENSHGSLYRVEDSQNGGFYELRTIHSRWLESLNYWQLREIVESVEEAILPLSERVEHIDRVVHVGVSDDQAYMVFAGDSSFTLRSLMSEGRSFPLATVREVALQVLQAFREAHQSGMLHLDIRPENILLTVDRGGNRLVRVRGFGIARILAGTENNLSLMTKSAQTVSGPEYMSPEMFTGKTVDARSDLYSLGILLFEMLEGRVPFRSDSLIDMLLQHLHEPPPAFSSATASQPDAASVCTLITSLLQKNPDKRPDSAEQCIELLCQQSEQLVDEALQRPEVALVPVETKGEAEQELGVGERLSLLRRLLACSVGSCVVMLAVLLYLLLREDASPAKRDNRIVHDKSSEHVLPKAVPDDSAVEEVTSAQALESTSEQDTRSPDPGPPVSIKPLGMVIRPVHEQFMKRHGLRDAGGLLVQHLEHDGLGFQAGLRTYDVIQRIETKGESIVRWQPQSVRTIGELEAGMASAWDSGQRLALIVKRGSFDGLVVFISPPRG